jgi:hypothetical protein
MKHESNDVKQLTAQIVILLSKSASVPLSASTLKGLIPMLVMGTKEKNAAVKSYSEQALVSALRLRQGDSTLEVSVQIRIYTDLPAGGIYGIWPIKVLLRDSSSDMNICIVISNVSQVI